MRIDSWLKRTVTDSQSLLVEYGYWALLAIVEVKAKLLSEGEKELVRQQAKHVMRMVHEVSDR